MLKDFAPSKFSSRSIFVLLFVFSLINQIHAQEKPKLFKDSLDNAFDISHYLYTLHGLLPVLMPITEPAVGYGAAGALIYFIPKKKETPGFQMPDMALGLGGYTANGTWFAGGGYIGFWNEDRLRYRGILGYGDIKMDYYGLGDRPFAFNLNSYFFLQQLVFRLGESDFFLGGKYQLTSTKIIAFADNDLGLDPIDFDINASGVSLISEFENYDNPISPGKGIKVHASYAQNLEALGSDRNFGTVEMYSHMYFPVSQKWMPALRVESQIATGDVPFYALPYVNLRGVPALRYQGSSTLLIETEHAFNITPRWGLVGFGGLGQAFTSGSEEKSKTAWNVGGGFRYLVARVLGLKMGIDVARGPEDWAIYTVFGTSWAN